MWECPPLLQTAIEALIPVDKMSRFLEDDAVPFINDDLITEIVNQCTKHQIDPGMASALMNGLAKIGGNANNHRALVRSGSIPLGVALMAYHPEDLHVCETVLMLLLPFSFNLEITRLMSEAGAVPVLVSAMVRGRCDGARLALVFAAADGAVLCVLCSGWWYSVACGTCACHRQLLTALACRVTVDRRAGDARGRADAPLWCRHEG